MSSAAAGAGRQHLIDPESCIRCNTCEESCPVGAIHHDTRNYVVDAAICEGCHACLAPCPTGAIDQWYPINSAGVWSTAEQLAWESLPELPRPSSRQGPDQNPVSRAPSKIDPTHARQDRAPWSADRPVTQRYSAERPAIATVVGNVPLCARGARTDIRHIVLDFGDTPFPFLEGQTLGILPPGFDRYGRPQHLRLYSVASARDGERAGRNNLALIVKRVTQDHAGNAVRGVASNYLCNLSKGDSVRVAGPFGESFLMPQHTGSSLLMICTGTGVAPMRAMIERRRRSGAADGKLMLFLGARSPEEFPYFGRLRKLPAGFLDLNLAFSRLAGAPRMYVQDLLRQRAAAVAAAILDESCFIYLCGLKAMEPGVAEALADVCAEHGLNWQQLQPALATAGRYHVETY